MHILKLTSNSDPTSPGGGQTSYKTVPPLSSAGDGPLPSARFGHTAVSPVDGTHQGKLVVFGGSDDPGHHKPLEEGGRVWIFDPETLHWTHLDPASKSTEHPGSRVNHASIAGQGSSLIIHGGSGASGSKVDTWHFNLTHRVWSLLPELPSVDEGAAVSPLSSSPPAFAINNETVHILTSAVDNLSMTLYSLDLTALGSIQQQQGDSPHDYSSASWSTAPIPTNPLTASPSLKNDGATFLTISTGLGRSYLLHLMGAHGDSYSSAIYALQLPSPSPTPASVKDVARENIPRASSHQLEWHAVEVVAKEEGATPATWLQTFDSHQQNVRTTVTQAASVAGGWIKGRARAISNAARDLHVGGVDEPEPEPEPVSERKHTGPVLEDNENEPPQPIEPVATTGTQEEKGEPDKDDLPLSSNIPHRIKPGAEANALEGKVSGKAHPGPRAWFGAAVLGEPSVGIIGTGEKPARVIMWGGLNAKGEQEGDGWLVELRV